MPEQRKSSGAALKRELYSLAKIAQKLGQSFTPDKPQQVLALLSWANEQKEPLVREALVKVGDLLSSSHRIFFERSGIDFEHTTIQTDALSKNKTRYRGVEVGRQQPNSESELSSTKGKRKIIYRGQEKWV